MQNAKGGRRVPCARRGTVKKGSTEQVSVVHEAASFKIPKGALVVPREMDLGSGSTDGEQVPECICAPIWGHGGFVPNQKKDRQEITESQPHMLGNEVTWRVTEHCQSWHPVSCPLIQCPFKRTKPPPLVRSVLHERRSYGTCVPCRFKDVSPSEPKMISS